MFIDAKDNGSGISNKDPQRIFAGNEGLGLNYGFRIARRLGGDLVLVESSNQGSLFRIILPCGERSD
jgi:signal transduction histidine kinase